MNVAGPPSPVGIGNKENVSANCNLPPKSRSPNKLYSRRFSTAIDVEYSSSTGSCSRRASNIGDVNSRASQDVKELPLDYQQEPLTPGYGNFILQHIFCYNQFFVLLKQCLPCSSRFSEIQRKWKEELDEELERTRGKFYLIPHLNFNYKCTCPSNQVICILPWPAFWKHSFQNEKWISLILKCFGCLSRIVFRQQSSLMYGHNISLVKRAPNLQKLVV